MPSTTTHPRRPVPRLNVPPSERMWGVESLHGVRLGHCPFADKCTTVFPAASASARSFNRTLWHAIGVAMADELRWANPRSRAEPMN